jgi:hypothetical protein
MRRFLYVVAALTFLVLAGAFVYRIYERELTEFAFVPRGAFEDQPALATNAYADPAMWYSHPGLTGPDPSRYEPEPATLEPASPGEGAAADPEIGQAAASDADGGSSGANRDEAPPTLADEPPHFLVFFVHPTSYIPVALASGARWNASLGNAEAESRARLFLRGLASPFAGAEQVWAPRYRQASFGAFLTDQPEAQLALDLAYRDVAMAFDHFVANAPADLPIVLAGHSQGALHVLTLLREKVLGTPLERRIAMVYPVGWPISVAHDLPALGLPACQEPDQAGCIMTWSSFAEPADPGMVLDRFTSTPGFDGRPRGEGPILCVNPLTGERGGAAPAAANLGTLHPAADFSSGTLVPRAVPARCDEETGLLLIGDPPQLGPGVLPGNNYHVYDIPLFWQNLRHDVARRLAAWSAQRP